MEITMRYVRGHVEVYTAAGQFLFSADTEAEAAAMLEYCLLYTSPSPRDCS